MNALTCRIGQLLAVTSALIANITVADDFESKWHITEVQIEIE